MMPATAWNAFAADNDPTVVIAGSDYQASGASGTMQKIMNQIKNKYNTAYGALLGGDYDGGDAKTTAADIEAVDADIDAVFPGIAAEHRIYLQGNHESWSGLNPSSSNLMNETGAYDTDYYGVYAINHKDYPWYMSNPTASLVQDTAANLDTYLDAKVADGYDKPIFIMSHLPLHYSTRTYNDGDGKYAKYLYDVLDEAGDKGLNIIFLFGHNHSSTYDDYLGGGQIYLEKGDSICVAEEGSKTSYFTDELSFTYMNYGYVGTIKGNAGKNLSMTTFEITDDEVIVNRYGTSGTVELKAAGVTTSGAPTADTSTVKSGVAIELNKFEPDATLTGITVTAPAKTDYVVGDTLDTTGMVVTASYDDGSSKEITGYDVSADLTSAGTKTVTVTYKEKSATFEITVFAPVRDEVTGVTVAGPGISGLKVTKITEEIPEDSGYGAYVAYDITPIGNFSGTATVTVPVSANFDTGKPVKILDGDTVQTTTTIKNGTVTFTATHFSVYALAQDAQSELEWKEIPGGIVYQLDTDGVTPGTKYLIVNTAANGAGKVLRNAGGTEGTTDVIISGGTINLEDDTDVAWIPNNATSGHFENQGEYLRLNGGYDLVTGSSKTLEISNQNNGAYRISATVSSGGWWGSSSTYYLAYNSDWESTTTASNVYLYEYKGNGNGGYAAMTGTTVYNVITNTTDVAALEKKIRDNLLVYTATDANGTDAEATTDYMLTGTIDPTTAGEYTYTVTYGGVTLGNITVNVIDKEIEEIVISDNNGAVNKGASSAATTGATLTIKYKDGTSSEPIAITVGMLTDANGNKVSTATVGTITDIYVNYNGQKFPFTLTVNPKEGNNYPNYPDPGAVKVNKTATGIDFQASGVATVELSASGIPMNEGVDVVLVLDTSSSMSQYNKYPDENGEEMYRIDLLRPAVNNLIQQMKTKREDGSDPDIDIAIVTFNGNTVKADTNEIGGAGSRGTNYGIKTGDGTISGAWEAIKDIDSNWADDTTNHTPTGSGTNYDYGLQMAYDLLAQKKADSSDERQQFVLFLSDGSPSQYNGAESNDGVSEYVNWIRGNYDDTDTDASNNIPNIENKEFYTGFNNNNGQLHRSAEAIKAANTDSKEIIRFDSGGVGTLETVEGLGATVYSIGFLLEDGSARTEEDQITVLQTIASDESKFFNIDSVNDLSGSFSDFANAVLMAATNARFEDQMGQMYDLQLTPTDYLPVGETTEYSTINPSIEVRSYEIWTRAEYEAGTITDPDLIGTRKTNDNGTYKYTTLETVEFQYEKNGTNDYTLTGATSDQMESKNILSDGVICGKYFYYNTTSEEKNVDGIAVGAETFYWKLGDIKTTELAIRYNVSLTGALDGNREAGSYDTNQSAILYYDNYLGNPCQKEAISPTMAWKGAVVRYAFYLVDASSGKPVNNEGVEVPFSNRTIIVNPTDYANINLFSSEAVESEEIVASHVLPEGYWLYDESASYDITVRGNGTGEWGITGDDTLNNPNSTYVTGYDGDKYTYENSKNDVGYDYTHTTVWFAVKWEPQPIDDTVVVDYGLPVDVHVLTNDMFGKYGKLRGVTKGDVTEKANKAELYFDTTSDVGAYGTAVVNVPETGYTEANSVIRYTLNKDMGMQMKEPELFTYSVQYANPIETKNDGYYYGRLTVIPATTIYYEDDFVTYSSYTRDEKNGWETGNTELWSTVKDETYVENEVIIQDEDRPGDINYAFDTVIDADNVYGYDSAYKNCSKYSLGAARKITVDANKYGTAEFDFYGTGFDVIALTSNQTGTITVDVYNEEGTAVRSIVVDTYYGYTKNSDGEWVVSTDTTENSLYQIPVISVEGLDYGKYNAVITAAYSKYLDHKVTKGSYDLYVDAIRIYDPTGVASGTVTNDTVSNAYVKDNEGWPVYTEVRNSIIKAGTFDAADMDTVDGVVFIDGVATNAGVADYEAYGPNNEVYLASGQAIAFTLDGITDNVADVQIGLKSVGGTATVKVYNAADTSLANAKEEKLSTATGMYYSIADLKDGIVVISNTGQSGMASVTDVKVTYKADPNAISTADSGVVFRMSRAAVQTTLDSFIDPPVEEPETPVVPEEPEVVIEKADVKSVKADKETYTVKDTVKVTVETNNAAEYVTVNGNKITEFTEVDETRNWTYTEKTAKVGQETFTAVAYNEEEEASESASVTVNVKKYAPLTFRLAVNKTSVTVGDKVKATVTTGTSVKYVTINGKKVTKFVYNKKNNTRIWTSQVPTSKVGKLTVKAVAYSKNDSASKAITKTVTVKRFAPKIFNVNLNKTKVKVGDKYTVTVKAGSTVKYVKVNGKKITKFTTKKGVKTFKVTYKAAKAGKKTVKVVAFNKAGYATKAKTKTVTVVRR